MLSVEGDATARFLSKLSPARTCDITLHIFARQPPELGLGSNTLNEYRGKNIKNGTQNKREEEKKTKNPATMNKWQTLCHRLGSPSPPRPSPLDPVGSDPLGRI